MAMVMSHSALKRAGFLGAVTLLIGCGGRPLAPVGFVNQTQHASSQLWVDWKAAQEDLSQQIDLNPLQRVFQTVPADMRPGDARVWDVAPRQLVVASEADVTSAAFFAATGTLRPDPTGLITCPRPCNVRYAAAYSLFRKAEVRYAASWEPSESDFDYLLTYEFENQILNELGYDTRWR